MLFKFEDREVQFPNRVKLTPVTGQQNTYDVERAEGTITNPGTPLTAANLMKLQQYSNIAAYALEAEKASGYTRGGEIDANFKKSRMITRKRIDFSQEDNSIIYSESGAEEPRVSIVEFLPEGKTVEDIVGIGGTLEIYKYDTMEDMMVLYSTVCFSTMWNGKDSQEPHTNEVVPSELLKSDQMAGIIGISGIYSDGTTDTKHHIDLCYMTLGISKRGNVFMEGTPVGTRLALKSQTIGMIPISEIKIRHLELYF